MNLVLIMGTSGFVGRHVISEALKNAATPISIAH